MTRTFTLISHGGVRKYYSFGGRAVAMGEIQAGGGAGTVYYLLADHLGSTVALLDADGAKVSEAKYWPYGATRSGGVTQTDMGFTFQRQEPDDAAGLGLYNYKARFYSTVTGRFVSADTLASRDPQLLNRYSNARNNPSRLVDPSGLCIQDANGNWLPCSREDMITWFLCAWGGECDTGGFDLELVRILARWVVNTDSFKYFVAYESNEISHHPILLIFALRGKIIDPANVTVGGYTFWFAVNATERLIIGAGAGFDPGKGVQACWWIFCMLPGRPTLDSWQGQARFELGPSGSYVSFAAAGGPEYSWSREGLLSPCVKNPFVCLGLIDKSLGMNVTWGAAFVDGQLEVQQKPEYKRTGWSQASSLLGTEDNVYGTWLD